MAVFESFIATLQMDRLEYVRNVKGKKRERGSFTVDELRKLFLAGVTGARRGELLVLRWRRVHFDRRFIHITDAWKGRNEIGDTIGS